MNPLSLKEELLRKRVMVNLEIKQMPLRAF